MFKQLKLIVKNELLTDIRGKGFWIGTIIVPIIIFLISIGLGLLMSQSDTFANSVNELPTQPDADSMTPAKAAGMLLGIFLTFFLMIYGSMIFTKVKTEKCNRIMEILSTCVEGKTMMMAKIISVGLFGLIQLCVWTLMICLGVMIVVFLAPTALPFHYLANPKLYLAFLWMLLYFIGGYVLFGSLYAACGAITDKDNENQVYMTVITFILLGSFYIGEFAVDNGSSIFAVICNYIPLTSPTVGTINAISETSPIWQTLISLAILYATAFFSVVFAGKLYRSSLLLKGKQFTLKDIVTFLKS